MNLIYYDCWIKVMLILNVDYMLSCDPSSFIFITYCYQNVCNRALSHILLDE